MRDQILEAQYNLFLKDMEEHEEIEYTFDELMEFPDRSVDTTGPGFTAELIFGEEGHHDIIMRAKGSLKMMRVWAKEGEPGEQPLELFEGSFSLEVIYNWKYQKKVGPKEVNIFSFWAVRAGKATVDGRQSSVELDSDACVFS